MWTELYNKTKEWMADQKPERFIIQSLQNQREMRSSYNGTYELIALLKFLEMKSGEEQALANGDIENEGALMSSITQLGGPYYG